MICPRCKTKAKQGDKYCVGCGLKLGVNSCPTCGAPSQPDDAFCANCGKKLMEEKVEGTAVTAKAEVEEKVAAEPKEVVFTHELLREIAATYEYNTLSPLFALHVTHKSGKRLDIPIKDKLFDAILNPSKAFYLTVATGGIVYQKILLVKDSICCRWVDYNGKVIVTEEKSARAFLNYIYGEISPAIQFSEKLVLALNRGQIVILKGIYSLCQAIARVKVSPVFTTYDRLRTFLKADDKIKKQLEDLAAKGMVKLIGVDNPIITLQDRGEEIYRALEAYKAFYTMQVLTEGREEFPSLHLVSEGGRLYMMSNPGNGEEVIIRTLDASGLRSLLNWLWIADIYPEEKIGASSTTEPLVVPSRQDIMKPSAEKLIRIGRLGLKFGVLGIFLAFGIVLVIYLTSQKPSPPPLLPEAGKNFVEPLSLTSLEGIKVDTTRVKPPPEKSSEKQIMKPEKKEPFPSEVMESPSAEKEELPKATEKPKEAKALNHDKTTSLSYILSQGPTLLKNNQYSALLEEIAKLSERDRGHNHIKILECFAHLKRWVLLRDKNSKILWGNLYKAIEQSGDSSATPLLLDITKDPEEWTRLYAVGLLGSIGDKRALNELHSIAISDPNWRIRKNARDSISMIQNRN